MTNSSHTPILTYRSNYQSFKY
ncbi:hypothetical protein PSAC2689_100200 [Paraburkholderia sacchari]